MQSTPSDKPPLSEKTDSKDYYDARENEETLSPSIYNAFGNTSRIIHMDHSIDMNTSFPQPLPDDSFTISNPNDVS